MADSFDLVVGELLDDGSTHIVWNAGPSSDGAIGGVLAQRDDQILIGVGRNTGWDTTTKVGGAILTIDPDGPPTQAGTALSVGYTNPWAFVVTLAGDVWVADNASGPDPDDESRDDVERIGRADLVDDRNDMAEVVGAGRAPTAMVELSDGRLGICGFLDNEMHAFEVVDTDAGPRTALERAGTIMPCLTGAAVFADGTIVTATQDSTGNTLQIRRP